MRSHQLTILNNLKLSCVQNKAKRTNKAGGILIQTCSLGHSSKMASEKKREDGFKRLPLPVKGLSDKYEYSVIQLNNGLTALLVSDVENLITLDSTEMAEPASTESMSDSESENESGSETDEMDAEEKKSEDEKLAALSLTIGVGSFCDGDIPGLAHFLEHMVFMGSGKYPQENDFDAYLSSRGGSTNASTEYETTTFYFDVSEPHLKQSMDIFSNFFIEPLLRKDSMRNEMEIVDSEFQSSILVDQVRLEQLFATLCSIDNPAGQFAWGNLESLRNTVEEKDLYAKLQELRCRHYVANHMTLALQARLDLATLEDWVVEHFSAIPSNRDPKPSFKSDPPFVMEKWHNFFTVKPVDDVNELHMTWFTPPVQNLYRAKPLDFLSYYIGHEGPGSIISYLRDTKLWATSIEAGYDGSGFDDNQMYSLFTIDITLSDEGAHQIKHILDVVFQYISLLSTSSLYEQMYDEISRIQQIGFDYKSAKSSSNYVEELSVCMQYYPSEEYLTGGFLFKQYDETEIRRFLSFLSPERLNITLLSKIATRGDDVVLDEVEEWFKTEYKVEPIDSAWITEWKSARPPAHLYLPNRNEFVTTDFSQLPLSEEVKYPIKILQTDSTEVWFKQTLKYQLPRAVVYFILEIPRMQTAKRSVLYDLFLDIVNVTLTVAVYNAYLAQYYVVVARGDYGIHITLNGFSQHIEHFLNIVLKHLATVDISPELFAMAKDSLLRSYTNNLKDCEVLRRALRIAILIPDSFMIEDKYKILRDEVTHQDLLDFRNTLLKKMYVKCLSMGNISESTTLSLISYLTSHLPFTPLESSERRELRVTCLESQPRILRVQSLNEQDPNLCVFNYYQSAQNTGSLRESCILEILVEIIAEPLFDTLRTKQKLGYHVNTTVRDTFGILGLSVVVESQISKHTADEVEAKMHEFTSRYVRDNLDSIRDKYEDIIATLVKKKKMAEINLKEESSRYFEEIKVHDYLFDRQEREADLIQTIRLEELVEWIDKNIAQAGKKLSVQIVGTLAQPSPASAESVINEHVSRADNKRKHSESEDKHVLPPSVKDNGAPSTVDNGVTSTVDMNSVNLLNVDEKKAVPKPAEDLVLKFLASNESDTFITDIKTYRETLALYPVTKLK